jgi:hypothetical protein
VDHRSRYMISAVEPNRPAGPAGHTVVDSNYKHSAVADPLYNKRSSHSVRKRKPQTAAVAAHVTADLDSPQMDFESTELGG